MKRSVLILSVFVAVLSGVGSSYYFSREFAKKLAAVGAQDQRSSQFVNFPSQAPSDFTLAAENSVHAVVHVKTTYYGNANYYYGNPLLDFFFGNPNQNYTPQPQQASGSGVIISGDGYIVTNNHVIDGSNEIEVVLNDKRVFKAKVVGADPNTDIALLKVDGENLPFLTIGSSDDLRLGEWVLAVGNPFNLTSTVTAGIVSAKARSINLLADGAGPSAIESFIQTDAAVNPGNSGGALVNTRGELVGINTAIASRTGSYSGYSFAIPVSIARKVVDDIKEFGAVQRAFIGVGIKELTQQEADKLGVKVLKGVLINGVDENGGAAEAGIKTGDIILSINGVEVNSPSELQEQVSRFRPKDQVEINVLRESKQKLFKIVLRNKAGSTDVVKASDASSALGAKLVPISNDLKKKFGLRGGVQVAGLSDGLLKSQGVKEGYIITQIDRKLVTEVEDVATILRNASGGVLIEGIYPNGVVAYYALGIGK